MRARAVYMYRNIRGTSGETTGSDPGWSEKTRVNSYEYNRIHMNP
eukprot:SAG22_NODE_10501_length_530_cov_1.159722_2_plen_44_part_01